MIRRFVLALPVLLAATAPLPAQRAASAYDPANLSLRGVGGMAFGLVPARSDPAVGVQFRADLGELAPSLRIVPVITFWASQYRESEVLELARRVEALCERGGSPCPGLDPGEVEVSDLSLEVDAQYLWTTSIGLEPYAGVGVGLHLLNGSGDLIDDTFVEDILDGIAPGVSAHAGIELPLSSALRIHGEARGALAGSASWAGIGLGGAWRVGGTR